MALELGLSGKIDREMVELFGGLKQKKNCK